MDKPMDLEYFLNRYKNIGDINDAFFDQFKELTDSIPYLRLHREWVEKNRYGFGEKAFHYLWYLLFKDISKLKNKISALEIGVYRGQIISLWALISKREKIDICITGISPFKGNVRKNLFSKLSALVFDKRYRRARQTSYSWYELHDYISDIKKIFSEFNLDFSKINLKKGYSQDKKILKELNKEYDIIYIDGDHSYKGVKSDLALYCSKIRDNGYLVLDDAGYFLPGSKFWKGIKTVSEAAENIDRDKFKNIINIGHNRIYQKTGKQRQILRLVLKTPIITIFNL